MAAAAPGGESKAGMHDLRVHSAHGVTLTLWEPVRLCACKDVAVCCAYTHIHKRSAVVRDRAETVNKQSTHTPAIAGNTQAQLSRGCERIAPIHQPAVRTCTSTSCAHYLTSC